MIDGEIEYGVMDNDINLCDHTERIQRMASKESEDSRLRQYQSWYHRTNSQRNEKRGATQR